MARAIKEFFQYLVVEDVHSKYNRINQNEIDNTFIRGSFPIGTIVITTGLSIFIKRYRLFETNKFMVSDH